jgi:threonylcarbamoyladenosine tRNA methylthiotransferase CDKAL1
MPNVHVITQGCSGNLRESELMMGLLDKSGHQIVKDEKNSEVNVVNICTVKGDFTAMREIRRIKRKFPDKKLVIAGCITPSIMPQVKELDASASFINTHNFGKINTVVDGSMQGSILELMDKKYENKVDLPSVRKNPIVGIIPILNGCNYFCTFCSTKLVKGKLFSYPIDAIKADLKNHLRDGCREIWITSNDTGAYMVDKGGKQKLVELMNNLLSVPMDFKVRIGMMNPGNTITVLDRLIEVYKHPKMFKFLHIPLQAGNNEVLKGMNRRYTVEEFVKVVEAFRKEIPKITISTDMIVGFPTETIEQFEDSLKVLRKIKPDTINISRYVMREGTIAAKMKLIATNKVKYRSREMTKVYHEVALENNLKWVGWSGKILIDEKGTGSSFVGRNYCYKPVSVFGDYKLGDEVKVKVEKATKFGLRGVVCR